MNAAIARKAGVLVALGLSLGAAPARAADDGQASLLTGIATQFGLVKEDDQAIHYRERGKLVLPPKNVLPPPGSAAHLDGAWPVNVETVRERNRKKMDEAEPSALQMSGGHYQLIHPGDDVKVTTSGLEESDGPSCRHPDPKTGECPAVKGSGFDWNPMTWVGLKKKAKVELGPEPERENLVDPPKGYRAPAEGVGAKIDQ